MTGTLDGAVVAGYVLVVVAIGAYFRGRQDSSEAFLLADRTLGPGQVFASTFSTFFGTGIVATFASFGYLYGVGAFALPAAAVLGFLPLALAAPRIEARSDRRGAVTLPGLVAREWSSRTRALAAVLTGGLFAATLAANLLAAGTVLGALAGVPVRAGVVLLGVPVVAATALGGFRAVVWTDVLQMVIVATSILLVLPALVLLAGSPGLAAGLPTGHLDPLAFPAPILAVYLLVGPFTFFGSQDLFQRVYAARDGRAARRGLLLFTGSLAVVGAAAVLLGVLGRATVPGAVPDQALLALADHAGRTAGVLVLGFLALANSDADSQLLTVTSTLTHDVLPLLGVDFDRRGRAWIDRLSALGVGTAAVAVAAAVPDLAALLGGLGTAFAILGVVVVGTLYWDRTTDPAASAGLAVGSLSAVAVVVGTGAVRAAPVVGVASTATTVVVASLLAEWMVPVEEPSPR